MRRTSRTTLTLALAATLAVPAAAPLAAAGTPAQGQPDGDTLVRQAAARTAAAGSVGSTLTRISNEALARREAAKASLVRTPKLSWKSCGTTAALKDFQCTSVEVPTDYDRPWGPTTTIALTRLPASNPAAKLGSLFTNPGGPGGEGVGFVQQNAKTAYTAEVRAKFDVIGFDPRGVGKSDPVTCFPTEAEETAALKDLPAFPVGAAEIRSFTLANVKLAANCLATSPDRLAHFSTANVARDLDLLRRAVGDRKLTYIGYSYGTALGATYAKLFPRNARALVLDGTLSPEWYSGSDGDRRPVGVRLRQGEGASDTFEQFLAECKKAGGDQCVLAKLGDPATVAARMFEQVKKQPVDLPLPDGTTLKVTYAVAVQVTFQTLYDPIGWPGLAETIAYLAAPPAKTARQAARTPRTLIDWNRRQEDYASAGTFLQPCVDGYSSGRPLEYGRFAADADRRAPYFGGARAWVGLTCEFLPIRDRDAFLGPWENSMETPVLVYGTRYDPATPYQATRPYADLFPDARMVTVEGWGHTTLGKSSCADAQITAYLVNRKAPADNSTCAQDRKPFDPLPTTATARTAAAAQPGR